jgi:hypothetical protein
MQVASLAHRGAGNKARASQSSVIESGEIVTDRWAWMQAWTLYGPAKPAVRAVLLAIFVRLKKQSNGQDTCYPGLKSLADMTGMGRRHVINSLNEARRAGWIRTLRRGRPRKGGNEANVYTPTVPQGFEVIEQEHEKNDPKWKPIPRW